jgi:hypothetical protein
MACRGTALLFTFTVYFLKVKQYYTAKNKNKKINGIKFGMKFSNKKVPVRKSGPFRALTVSL